MYCARDFSSLQNINSSFAPVRKILGILGYSKEALLNYSGLHRTPLETSQSIDQSRILENDLDLISVQFSGGYPGINELREAEIVKKILKTDDKQKKVLNKILNEYER
jgi:CMP-2-keto-3-deoxyoctulosonic acid synthetase